MRPDQAGPEGDEIVEQECSAFWWIPAMDAVANRNQIFEYGSDGGAWEGSVHALGSLCSSLAALPWSCIRPPPCWEKRVGLRVSLLASLHFWSVFSPDDLGQAVGPACHSGCSRSWVGEKDPNGCCFLRVCTVRQGGSTFLKQAGHLHLGPRKSFLV